MQTALSPQQSSRPENAAPKFRSSAKVAERNPALDHPDAQVKLTALESTRQIVQRGLSDGAKAVPQVVELLNSTDQDLRAAAIDTLQVIGSQLLKREREALGDTRTQYVNARMDILANFIVLATDGNEPKELVARTQKAARSITTTDQRTALRMADKEMARKIFGDDDPKVELPRVKE